MTDANIDMTSITDNDSNLTACISLGNFGMEVISPLTQTLADYRTIVGLSPKESTSLLTIDYRQGDNAVSSSPLKEQLSLDNCSTCAKISLSPMRVVFVQSQIFFFLGYLNDDILGPLAAKAADATAAAARDAVTKVDESAKLFQIEARGFDIIVPRAAPSGEYLQLTINDLMIRFRSCLKDGSKAELSLKKVTMSCHEDIPFFDPPVRWDMLVLIPPDEMDAMILNMNFSEASFLLSRGHYAQIMNTLAGNIGETNPFLGLEEVAERASNDKMTETESKPVETIVKQIDTAAAVETSPSEKKSRPIHVKLNFKVLGIHLTGRDEFEPIVSLAAVDTNINVKMSSEKMSATLTLHNVFVEDKRISSLSRHIRNMVSRINVHDGQHRHDETKEEIECGIKVDFCKYTVDESSDISLVVASHQIVVLPDVITELLKFSDISDLVGDVNTKETPRHAASGVVDSEGIRRKVSTRMIVADEEVETALVKKMKTRKSNIKVKTSGFRLVLVDMGNNTGAASGTKTSEQATGSLSSASKQLTEIIVFQGKVDIEMSTLSSVNTIPSMTLSNRIIFTGDNLQMYVAQSGRESERQLQLLCPEQILEPASFSVTLETSSDNVVDSRGVTILEENTSLSMETTSKIDLTVSMQNVALLNAVVTSISDSFQSEESDDQLPDEEKFEEVACLSCSELSQIRELSSALQGDESKAKSQKDAGTSGAPPSADTSNAATTRGSSLVLPNVKKILKGHLKIPDVQLVMINDLQGLDTALFKIFIRHLILEGSATMIPSHSVDVAGDSSDVLTQCNMKLTSTFLADYYDTYTNLWHKFFDAPWDLSFDMTRDECGIASPPLPKKRFATKVTIESQPFQLSLSEQFLVSLGAANNMWVLYNTAMEKAAEDAGQRFKLGASSTRRLGPSETKESSKKELSLKKSMAANAARALVTTLPYGVDNHTGLQLFFSISSPSPGEDKATSSSAAARERRVCCTGITTYFQFELQSAEGRGGKRVYGQDSTQLKCVEIYSDAEQKDAIIKIDNLDSIEAVAQPRRVYRLGEGRFVFCRVVKTTKATIISLHSHLTIHNSTILPVQIALRQKSTIRRVGTCYGRISSKRQSAKKPVGTSYTDKIVADGGGITTGESKQPSSLGVPITTLSDFKDDEETELLIYPNTGADAEEGEKWGVFSLPSVGTILKMFLEKKTTTLTNVTCHSPTMTTSQNEKKLASGDIDGPCIQVCLKLTPVSDSHPYLEVFLQPRSILTNHLPVSVSMKSLFMSRAYTFDYEIGSVSGGDDESDGANNKKLSKVIALEPEQFVEIFTPEESINVSFKIVTRHVAGISTTWVKEGEEEQVVIPMGYDKRLNEPLRYLFPYVKEEMGGDALNTPSPDTARGLEFVIREKGGGVNAVEPLSEQTEPEPTSSSTQVQALTSEADPKPPVTQAKSFTLNPFRKTVDKKSADNKSVDKKSTDNKSADKKSTDKTKKKEVTFSATPEDEAVPMPDQVLKPESSIRSLSLSIENYAFDFTDQFMFEPGQAKKNLKASKTAEPSSFYQYPAFPCPYKHYRMSLLPPSTTLIRLIHMPVTGSAQRRITLPFCQNDVSICDGGLESSPIVWDDSTLSGYFAYRQFRSVDEFQLHIIPEFVVFNGSQYKMVIKKPSGCNVTIAQNKIAPLYRDVGSDELVIMIEVPGIKGEVNPIRVDALGLNLCLVTSKEKGQPLGSVAVQTVVGQKDSRLAIKIGAVTFGGKENENVEEGGSSAGTFDDDEIHVDLNLSELRLTLNDTQAARIMGNTIDVDDAESKSDKGVISVVTAETKQPTTYAKTMRISMKDMELKYQRVFMNNDKGDDKKNEAIDSPEQSDVAIMLRNMTILDCTPQSKFPVVFDSSNVSQNLLDVRLKVQGSTGAELVKVQLLDICFAYDKMNKQSNQIIISTAEDFVWSIVDVMGRINSAISDVSEFSLEVDWDDDKSEYIINIIPKPKGIKIINPDQTQDCLGHYTPPKSDKLYDIETIQISPISLQVSFRRKPQESRYENSESAKIIRYALKKLKFTLDRAKLYFAGYLARDIKGPSDRIVEIIQAVYISRVKLQFLRLVTATSFVEWKDMTGRDTGEDEYVEGDVLRLTGNMLGVVTGGVLKGVTHGLGEGLITVTSTVGGGIQHATEFVGLGIVGAGVNTAVSGLGSGVGTGVKIVGDGADTVLRTTGKGIGKLFGSLGGSFERAFCVGAGNNTTNRSSNQRTSSNQGSDENKVEEDEQRGEMVEKRRGGWCWGGR